MLAFWPLREPQAILILMLLAQYRFSFGRYGNKVCYSRNKQTYIGDKFVCYKGSVLFCPPTYSMLLASARWLASKQGEKIELCCVPLRRPQAILILMLLAQFGGILSREESQAKEMSLPKDSSEDRCSTPNDVK